MGSSLSSCGNLLFQENGTFRRNEASFFERRRLERLARGILGACPSPLLRKFINPTGSEMLFSAFFHEIFLQNSISCKCITTGFYVLPSSRWPFRISYCSSVRPHPCLPVPSLAMAGLLNTYPCQFVVPPTEDRIPRRN